MNWSEHITSMAGRVRRTGTVNGLHLGPDFSRALWETWSDVGQPNELRRDAKFLIDEFGVVKPLSALMRAD